MDDWLWKFSITMMLISTMLMTWIVEDKVDTRVEEAPLQCQEDEVIIGVGDFDEGSWTAYVCHPYDDAYETEYMDGYRDSSTEQSFGGDYPQIGEAWSSTPTSTPTSDTPTAAPTGYPIQEQIAPKLTPMPTPTLLVPCTNTFTLTPSDDKLSAATQTAADSWNRWFGCVHFVLAPGGLPVLWEQSPCGTSSGACWTLDHIGVAPWGTRSLSSVLMHEIGHTMFSHQEEQPEAPNVMSAECWYHKSYWIAPNESC
jgi:hypothetical protein